ncbi:unnamed protein product, partial [Staurois parvus]
SKISLLVIPTVELGVNPPHCVKRLFDPAFSDLPLLLLIFK